jgi:manganese efflux pump family protein
MSSLSALLLVSLSLGLSNFAAAIGIGLGGVDAKARWQIALVFGFFEAAMPILGLLLGQGLAGAVGGIGHFFGAGLLILTGAYTLWQAWKSNQEKEGKAASNPQTRFSRLLLAGLALSLDNLVVGFALSFSHISFLLAGGVIALVSIGMSLVGLELGNHVGKRIEGWSEVFSGIILILVGLAIGFGLL